MEQPKFRGFSLETNSWHYGYGWFKCGYTEDYKAQKGINDKAILYTETSPIECELNSMGQYTGIKDKNEKEAYNGDLFYWHRTLRIIVYREDKGAFMAKTVHGWQNQHFYLNDLSDCFEIVGNEIQNRHLPFEISY